MLTARTAEMVRHQSVGERKPPLGVLDARNNEHHVCARRRVGEAAGTGGSRSRAAASYSSAANQREAVHSSDDLTVSPINFLKGRKQTDYLAASLDLPIRSALLPTVTGH